MKYIRRAEANVVDAIQYTGKNNEEMFNFCSHIDGTKETMFLGVGESVVISIDPGDYVVKDLDGSYHVCDGKEFDLVYDKVKQLSLSVCNYREFTEVVNKIPDLPFQFKIAIRLEKTQFDILRYELGEFSDSFIEQVHEKMFKAVINKNKYTIFYE